MLQIVYLSRREWVLLRPAKDTGGWRCLCKQVNLIDGSWMDNLQEGYYVVPLPGWISMSPLTILMPKSIFTHSCHRNCVLKANPTRPLYISVSTHMMPVKSRSIDGRRVSLPVQSACTVADARRADGETKCPTYPIHPDIRHYPPKSYDS
jgi:hypothetical protein